MLDKITELLEKTDDIKRSSYVWNAINAVLSAMQCPVALMFITRISGMNDGGVFSIAFAVANLLLYIGLYGLRRFQASDVNEEFTFADYNGMRFITCGAMVIASFVYCLYGTFFNSYSFEKAAVVFMVCLQQIEGNLIYPRVVGSNIGLPPIIMIAAIVVFSGFFGIIGLLVCGPVTSVLYTLLMRFVNNKIKDKNIPKEKYAVIKPSTEENHHQTSKQKINDNKKIKEFIANFRKKQ